MLALSIFLAVLVVIGKLLLDRGYELAAFIHRSVQPR